MRTITNLALVLALVAAGVATTGMFVGCSNEKNGKTEPNADTTDPALKDLPEKQREALSKLSAEDRTLALEQKICPVTGEPLGSMGKPIKVTVQNDKTVFVCCSGCVDAVEGEPEKYLEKLKKQ